MINVNIAMFYIFYLPNLPCVISLYITALVCVCVYVCVYSGDVIYVMLCYVYICFSKSKKLGSLIT